MTDEPGTDFFDLQQALAGRFSLERELGRGGMGVVYLAREVSLDRPVALKLLPPALAAQPAARERFLHEARTAAKLSHPNIVPIFAVDEVDEFVLFAMAYIDGETLGQRIRARGPRPASEVTRILREVAWALGYAHAQGVVHRDVKPDNILLESSSGRALLTDFGIASVVESAEQPGPGQVSGTAEFMSPEQAKGETVGPASDTYSLGAVGYYALSGRFPFEGSTHHVILAKHINENPAPVGSVAQGVPRRLAQAIDRCLAKDAAQRFANDEELAEALGLALPERRELPVALRVFIKREGRIGSGGALLYMWLLAMVAALAGELAPLGLGTLAGFGTFIAGVTLVPAGILINRARRLQRAGYGLDELVVAFKAEVDRAREEGAFEFGHGPSTYERVVRAICAGGLGLAALSGLGLAVGGGAQALEMTLALSLTTGMGAGVLALVRWQRRQPVDRQLRSWLWGSRLGQWVFRAAGLGLKRTPAAGSATYRPTEMAIGMAADRLFGTLPRELRRSLSELPDIVRKLQVDAQKMRTRIEELNGILAEVSSERLESRALEASPSPDESAKLVGQRQALEEDLRAARDATQQRLADAVAALETIRLGLLRMQAGSGSIESLTDDLTAARGVADDVGQLLEGQGEVSMLLRGD
ncbi:MAG: serine/threonine protein kinase [Gemmatimonadota bacterium]|nr:MAG: serine/threonine protein kinase [Gemmatimonadota bacterium]